MTSVSNSPALACSWVTAAGRQRGRGGSGIATQADGVDDAGRDWRPAIPSGQPLPSQCSPWRTIGVMPASPSVGEDPLAGDQCSDMTPPASVSGPSF
jgi:hypothetical protein